MTATVSLPIAVGPILGPVLGPVLGGVILNWLSWCWLFLVNVPVCAVGSYLAWRALPADAPVSAAAPAGAWPRLDLVGLLLVAPGVVGVLLGLSNVSSDGGFGHRDLLLPLIVGLVLLAAFAAWAVRRPSAGQRPVRPGFTAFAVLASFFLPGRRAAEPAQVAPAEVASAEEAAPAAAGQPPPTSGGERGADLKHGGRRSNKAEHPLRQQRAHQPGGGRHAQAEREQDRPRLYYILADSAGG